MRKGISRARYSKLEKQYATKGHDGPTGIVPWSEMTPKMKRQMRNAVDKTIRTQEE